MNRDSRTVLDHHGRQWPYLSVIFATDSHPFRPNIPGLSLANVFTFRSLRDVEQLIARAQTMCRTVVIGGGLLGLRGRARDAQPRRQRHDLENEPWLMARQLDRGGGEELARRRFDAQTFADSLFAVMASDRAIYTKQVVNRLQNEEKVIKASEHFEDDYMHQGRQCQCRQGEFATGRKSNGALEFIRAAARPRRRKPAGRGNSPHRAYQTDA